MLEKVKKWLELEEDYDDVLELMIETTSENVLSYCNLKEEDLEKKAVQHAILLGTIIAFNKRFREGLSSESLSGISSVFNLDEDYAMAISSIKKARVI